MRSHKLSTTLFALAAAAVVVVLSLLPRWSRSSATVQNGKAVVQVWAWNVAALSLQSLVAPFEAEHPDTHMVITRSGTNMQARLMLSLAANAGAPDITSLQQQETPRFIRTGRMLDLTSRAAKYQKDFPAAAWGNCVYDGKVHGVPWDMGPCGVFYRRSIFARYGIDVDKIETWDDYIEAGKMLLERSNGQSHMLTLATTDLTPQFFVLMQQNGGGIFDAQGRLALNTPQNREVLATLRRMFDAKISSPFRLFTPEYLASFKTDRVATHPIAIWMMINIKDIAPESAGDWGVFRLPAFHRGGLRASNLGGSALCIPAQTAHPQQAWEFVEYTLCTVKGQIAQYRDFGLFPAYLPALHDPLFDQPDPFFAGQKVNQVFAADIEKVPPLTRTSDWMNAERYLKQTLSAWAENRLDDGAFLHDAEAAMAAKFERAIAPPADSSAEAR